MRRTVLACAAAALAISMFAPAAGRCEGKSRYAAILENPGGRAGLAALAAMEKAATLDHPAIEKLVDDGEALVRVRCAEVLGRIGDPAGVPHLARLAADEDLRVVETAVYALGLIRDAAALDPLKRCLTDGDEAIKLRCLEALGVTRLKQAAPIIEPYLGHFKGAVRARAALALAFAGDSSAASRCEIVIQDADQHVAACAAYAMGRLGYRRGAERIAELLASPRAETRQRAVEALGRLKAEGAVTMIAAITKDADRWVALKAVDALQRIGSKKGNDALAALLASDDVYLKTAALNALAVTAEKRHAAAIVPLLADPSPMVRRAALGAAVAASGSESRPHLLAAIEKGPPRERATALELLGKLGKKQDLPLLCGMLVPGRDPFAAQGAASGLGNWERSGDLTKPCGLRGAGGRPLTAADALLAAADGEDWVVASIAVESLGKRGIVDAIPALVSIYRARRSRLDGDRRLAVVDAIAANASRIDEKTAASLGLSDFLAEGCADPDARVAAAAAAAAARFGMTLAARPAGPPDRGTYPWGEPSLPLGPRKILVSTARGDIEILLHGDDAPNAARSILTLARRGFYDGLSFHRIVPSFVIQGGCPRGDGWGDAGYFLRNEVNLHRYRRGTVGLADSGKDTAGSQFFIMHTDHPHLDGRYTIVGRVTRGMEVVDLIEEGDTFTVKVIE